MFLLCVTCQRVFRSARVLFPIECQRFMVLFTSNSGRRKFIFVCISRSWYCKNSDFYYELMCIVMFMFYSWLRLLKCNSHMRSQLVNVLLIVCFLNTTVELWFVFIFFSLWMFVKYLNSWLPKNETNIHSCVLKDYKMWN